MDCTLYAEHTEFCTTALHRRHQCSRFMKHTFTWCDGYNLRSSSTSHRILLLLLHLFNGLFSRTTWVSRHQKNKPFWILLERERIGWQWHQLDHMQIICTLLQTDNHFQYLTTQFLQAGCPSCHPTNSVKALKATLHCFLQCSAHNTPNFATAVNVTPKV